RRAHGDRARLRIAIEADGEDVAPGMGVPHAVKRRILRPAEPHRVDIFRHPDYGDRHAIQGQGFAERVLPRPEGPRQAARNDYGRAVPLLKLAAANDRHTESFEEPGRAGIDIDSLDRVRTPRRT